PHAPGRPRPAHRREDLAAPHPQLHVTQPSVQPCCRSAEPSPRRPEGEPPVALTDEARNAIADEAWGVAEKMKPSAASLDANRARFYMPEIKAGRSDGGYVLNGKKSFVTSGGHADLYPVLVNASGGEGLDVLVIRGDDKGVSFTGAWEGIGMTGNSSIEMVLDGVEIPGDRIVGAEGDGQELVFNVVAPTFLIGLAAVNVGIAQAALDDTIQH